MSTTTEQSSVGPEDMPFLNWSGRSGSGCSSLKKGFEAKDRRGSPLVLRVREEIRAGYEASDHLRETTRDVSEIFRTASSAQKSKRIVVFWRRTERSGRE